MASLFKCGKQGRVDIRWSDWHMALIHHSVNIFFLRLSLGVTTSDSSGLLITFILRQWCGRCNACFSINSVWKSCMGSGSRELPLRQTLPREHFTPSPHFSMLTLITRVKAKASCLLRTYSWWVFVLEGVHTTPDYVKKAHVRLSSSEYICFQDEGWKTNCFSNSSLHSKV